MSGFPHGLEAPPHGDALLPNRPLRGKGRYRLEARIAELEEALRPLTYSAAHNTCSGPGCIVCRARELLEGS